MRTMLAIFLGILLIAGSLPAEASRVGNGKSAGRQSSHVTQRQQQTATPARQSAPTSEQTAQPVRPSATAHAASHPRRPWTGMLGGLAAGLGLAWLAGQLGWGEGMAQVLLLVLCAAGLAGIWYLVRCMRRSSPSMAYQGASAKTASAMPASYNARNVGNDASARPWEAAPTAFAASQIGSRMLGASRSAGLSALSGARNRGVPDDFDAEEFLSAARRNFIALQDAWDKGDMDSLRAMMTDEMLAEITIQLAEREQLSGTSSVQKTEFGMLDAQLLGIEETAHDYLASVEFCGMVREAPDDASMTPFREVWNMSRAKTGGGWLVAGVQAMSS